MANLLKIPMVFTDRDHNGEIDFTEFLVGLRGGLNDRRKLFVSRAFNMLDTDKSGAITIDEMMNSYDVSKLPEVIKGEKTKEEAMAEFMSQWIHSSGSRKGVITYNEFEDYYKEVSASIDGDDYFELMMRNAWRMAGGEGVCANTANRRVLVTDKSGRQTIQTVVNDMGLKRGSSNDLKERLSKQGVNAQQVQLNELQSGNARPNQVSTASNIFNFPIQNQPVPTNTTVAAAQRSQLLADGQGFCCPDSNSISSLQLNAIPPVHSQFEPFELLRKVLFTPPCSLEQLAGTLRVSIATNNSRIPQGAFVARLVLLT